MKIKKRKYLPSHQVYDSSCTPVQSCDDYEESYIRHLKRFAKTEIENVKREQKYEHKLKKKELKTYQGKWFRKIRFLWIHTIGRLNEDWIFLSFLGFIMALISYGIDKLVLLFSNSRMYLYELGFNMSSRYFGWILLPFCLIVFNVGWVHMIGPQSAGSGLPELKTILRGVVLKEYLTIRVLIAKIFGIACTIGSGMPLGKEGPLVHMSSIVTTLYENFLTKINNNNNNFKLDEMRKYEMLAAAVAVGVSVTFAAPIGGVLFSIEVTTSYFAVRNYFRGFFAAVCGCITHRLLSIWIDGQKTYTPVFKTSFKAEIVYDPQELIAFGLMGVVCGFAGAFYCWCHRNFVCFTKRNEVLKAINNFCRFIYPGFVVLVISSITFPPGIGRYLAGHLTAKGHVDNLFSNFTWMSESNFSGTQKIILDNWRTSATGPYLHLLSFMGYMFLTSILASTMPIPSGLFIPTFRFGAAFGRIIGELMATWFPDGFFYGGNDAHVLPGGYAAVGAAAFTGAVTQTISVAIIVFEMTGQICHLLPVLIAVLVSVGISSYFGTSNYNNIILIKKLPYLPDLLPSVSGIYSMCAGDFMVKNVKYVHYEMTYQELEDVLRDNQKIKTFPIVANDENMLLLGSIQRSELVKLIEEQISRNKRLQHVFNKYFTKDPVGISNGNHEKSDDNNDNRKSMYDNPIYQCNPNAEMFKDVDQLTIDGKFIDDPARKEKSFRSIFRRNQKDVITPKGRILKLSEPLRDMLPNERKNWEKIQMVHLVDYNKCIIDPAPFQLVDRTSLLKIHSLFSLMGLKYAYVTNFGKLVGMISLKELRRAIEDVNSGNLKRNQVLIDKNMYIGIPKSTFNALQHV